MPHHDGHQHLDTPWSTTGPVRSGRDRTGLVQGDRRTFTVVGVKSASQAAVIGLLRRNLVLRLAVRRARTTLLRAKYRWFARGGVDPRQVVFESFGGRSYAGSPRAVYEAMLHDPRFAGFRFGWAWRDVGGPAKRLADRPVSDDRTEVVRVGSADYYRLFARARVWVTNSIVAPELVPRAQLYVQTWHGTGIKRIGLDLSAGVEAAMNVKAETDDRYRTEAAKINLFVSPSSFGTTVFSGAFGLPPTGPQSPFLEIGNPRNDALVRATRADIAAARARLGIPDRVRAVLYAPTFRDDDYIAGRGYVFRNPFDLDALQSALGSTCVFLFRTHYLISSAVNLDPYDGFVRDVSDIDEVNDLLLASDVLVTDYSSVCFDYSLLDRPIIFYLHDEDRFRSDLRGFYFPVEDLPGPLVRTQDALIAALLAADDDPAAERRRRRREEMCPQDDGHATERLLDQILLRLQVASARPVSPPVQGAVGRPVDERLPRERAAAFLGRRRTPEPHVPQADKAY